MEVVMNSYNKPIVGTIAVIVGLIAAIFVPAISFGQVEPPPAECGFVGTGTTTATQRGGQWMSSRDTVHVLVVFVQFPDDRYDTTYSLWPKNQPPTFMNTYIDSLPSQMSTNGNLSHYFRDMSMGAFKLTGKTRFIVTPHSRQWYLDNGWCRWLINKEVLATLDATLDFAEFDRWKRYGEYDIRREPDGRVDDIFMLYRNVSSEWATQRERDSIMSRLTFYGGESSLGYVYAPYGCGGPIEFYVDDGQRIVGSGHPAFSSIYPGMGTTSVIAGTGDGWYGIPPYRVQIHEFAHHWMTNGTSYGHSGDGFWAMLNDFGVRQNSLAQCPPNSYERELIGWHAPDSIYQTTLGVTLTDYVTMNRSVKIKIPGSNPNEFFRLEYHLKLSQFDNPEVHDPTAKGLYIIHQTGIDNPFSQLRLSPADGRWLWFADSAIYPPYWPPGLAVLEKSGVDRVNGYNDSYFLPFNWYGPPPGPSNPTRTEYVKDPNTNQIIASAFRGDGKDAFGLTKNNPITEPVNRNETNIFMN